MRCRSTSFFIDWIYRKSNMSYSWKGKEVKHLFLQGVDATIRQVMPNISNLQVTVGKIMLSPIFFTFVIFLTQPAENRWLVKSYKLACRYRSYQNHIKIFYKQVSQIFSLFFKAFNVPFIRFIYSNRKPELESYSNECYTGLQQFSDCILRYK